PNATSTYAYNPPVSDTRLPASAKHSTMRPIAIAQTTYAIGAAAPSAPAAAAGRRKMPPPTVMLRILAARPHVPNARTRDRSLVPRITLEPSKSCREWAGGEQARAELRKRVGQAEYV